jgi:tetratricopeptide (TPR) repeat protein
MRIFTAVAVLVFHLSSATTAQQHSSHNTPALTLDVLQRPISIRSGIGTAHDTVPSLPPRAQAYYDQGLALLHNYVWIDAARSFHEVLRLAPGSVMGSIGLSYAQEGLNMRTAARETVAQARRSAGNNPHEAAHLRARELDLAAQAAGAPASAFAAYRAALDEAIAQHPNDIELLLLRGVAASGVPGDRGQSATLDSVKYYEQVLRISPASFAAQHYLTHAYENAGNVTRALESAEKYAGAAVAVPHAHHMLGHDLRRVGRIKDAITQFETADRLERQYFEAEKVVPETDWHYEHNLDLLGTSYQYTGQVQKASALLQAAFDLPTSNLIQAVNKRQWPLMLRLLGRNDAAMAAAAVLATYPHPVVQAIGQIETAHVWMAKGDLAKAATAANAALAALRKATEGAGLADVPMRIVQGEFLLRQGQRERGRPMLEEAIRRARAMRGPDEWTQALFELESIASAARGAGDWDLAATAATQMLAHDGAYGGSHLAMAFSAQHAGDKAAASRECLEARRLWADADADFPPLQSIETMLRALR